MAVKQWVTSDRPSDRDTERAVALAKAALKQEIAKALAERASAPPYKPQDEAIR